MKRILFLLFLHTSLSVFSQVPNKLTNEEKIYGLSTFWQEINYSFVYFNKMNQYEWDELYKQYILEVQDTENDYQYYRLLKKFCAYVNDGHTNVYYPKYIQDSVFRNHFGEYRLFLTNIDGKAIVTRVNESKKDEIPIGTEVVSVNGMPTEKYLEDNVIPYIASSTEYIRQDIAITRMLEGYVGTSYNVILKLPDGQVKSLVLTISKTKENAVYPAREKSELITMKWYDDDIAYIALNSFQDWDIHSQFQEKIPELKRAKALIVDLRNNGGGNTNIGKVILHYLTKDTIFYGSRTHTRVYNPTLKAWGKDTYYYDFPYKPDTLGVGDRNLLKNKRIVVPTVFLIGHGTASAAEDFLILADKQEHITKIGRPTYGSTGQPLIFFLPGGGYGRVCTKKDTYPDGREFVGVGIQPDIFINKSLEDYINHHDPALSEAIEYLNENK